MIRLGSVKTAALVIIAASIFSSGCAGKQFVSKRQGEGDSLMASQNYPRAVDAYKKAAAEAKAANDPRDEAYLRSLLGWAYAGMLDFDGARRELKEGVRVAENAKIAAPILHARLAAVDSRAGALEEGMAEAETALNMEAEKWREASNAKGRDAIIDYAIANHGLPPDVEMIKTVTMAETARTVLFYLKGDMRGASETGEAAIRHFESLTSLMKMAPAADAREFYIGFGVAAATTAGAYKNGGETKKLDEHFNRAKAAFEKAGIQVKSGGLLEAYAEAGGYKSFASGIKAGFKAESGVSENFNKAEKCYADGNYRDAGPLYRAAIADAERAGNNEELARALSQSGWFSAELGKYPEAIRLMERSIAVSPRADYTAVTYARLSSIHARLGNYDRAIKTANNAIDSLVARRGWMFKGQNRDAVIDEAMKNPGLPPDMVLIKSVTASDGGRATAYYLKGDYGTAIKEGEKGVRHFLNAAGAVKLSSVQEQVSFSEGLAYTMLVTGDSFLHSGQPAKGREYLEKSREYFAKARLDFGDMAAEGLIGYSHALEGNYAEAGKYFHSALVRMDAAGLEDLKWHARNILARFIHEKALDFEARLAPVKADPEKEINACMDLQLKVVTSAGGLGRAVGQLSEEGKMLDGLTDRINKTQDCRLAAPLMSALVAMMKEIALREYEGAVASMESVRAELETDLNKRVFRANKDALYANYVSLTTELKGATAGFEALERAKARGIMDLLATKETAYRNGGALKEEREARETTALTQAELRAAQRGASPETREAAKRLSEELDRQVEHYRGVVIRVKRDEPELASFIAAPEFRYGEFAKTVPAGMTVAEYFISADTAYVWTADRKKVAVQKLDIPHAKLRLLVEAFRGAISEAKPEDTAELSQKLYKALVAPVEDKLGERVCIVASDALFYLPFAALSDGKAYFGQRHTLTFAPSAAVLAFAIQKGRAKGERMVAFANPDLHMPEADLPFAEAEAVDIAALYPASKVFRRSDATRKAVYTEIPGYDIIHFACHGELNEVAPMASALRLAVTGDDDGKLETGDIYGIDMKPYLVTLSACRTGLGTLGNGDEIVGMTRGFIYAGAPTVLSTLWSVNDESARALMVEFYKHLKSMDKDEALRRAQGTLIANAKFGHPFHWAAYYLTGDYR